MISDTKFKTEKAIAEKLKCCSKTILKNIHSMSTVEKKNGYWITVGEKQGMEKLWQRISDNKFKNRELKKNIKVAVLSCGDDFRNHELANIISNEIDKDNVWCNAINNRDIIIYYTEEISKNLENILENYYKEEVKEKLIDK